MMSTEVPTGMSRKAKAKLTRSKSSSGVASTSVDEAALVVAVHRDGNPFRAGAATLSASIWNRLRVYIQLVNGFPRTTQQQAIVVELLYHALSDVAQYKSTWQKLSSDHKLLMISFVCALSLQLSISLLVSSC